MESMLLERIAKRVTLADGYLASDRLKSVFKASMVFYGIHGFLVAMSFVYTALSAPPVDSEVGVLILAFQAGLAASVLTVIAVLIGVYALLALALRLAANSDSPFTALIISCFSFVLHGLLLLGTGALVFLWTYGISSTGAESGTSLDLFLRGTFAVIAIVGLIDLIVWFLLLFLTVSRSYQALAAALRRVPGRYEYSYGTTVLSSTERNSEVSFMEKALQSSSGYSQDDAEEIIDNGERYLVRFLHRNGKVVAASLQDRYSRRLMAVFPGRESKRLNASILLEDSYTIQREIRSEAQATLTTNPLILELAEESGWTVESDGDTLLNLRRV